MVGKARVRAGGVRVLWCLIIAAVVGMLPGYGGQSRAIADGQGLPTAFDWRDVDGCSYVTPVKNQGSTTCASCVAFGVVATMESTLQIQRNTPVSCQGASGGEADPYDLSEAQLFFCNQTSCYQPWVIIDPIGHKGALGYCEKHGVLPESDCIPYKTIIEDCEKRGETPCTSDLKTRPNSCCNTDAGKTYKIAGIEKFGKGASRDEIKAWISENGPVITSLYGSDKFFSYQEGIYTCDSQGQPANHFVSCIGYDDDKEAWLCKNSFGTNWGLGGYFWVGYGQCQIDTTMFGITGVTVPGDSGQ